MSCNLISSLVALQDMLVRVRGQKIPTFSTPALAPSWWCAAAILFDLSGFCSRHLCPQPFQSVGKLACPWLLPAMPCLTLTQWGPVAYESGFLKKPTSSKSMCSNTNLLPFSACFSLAGCGVPHSTLKSCSWGFPESLIWVFSSFFRLKPMLEANPKAKIVSFLNW